MPGQFVDSIINENLKVATEYFKATVASYQEDVNKKIKDSGGTIGFIPFKMSCILDGISGVKIYNELNVNTNFLPTKYTKTTKFIVTGVDHKLSNGDWETSLNLTLIPNASNIGIITREIVLATRTKEVKKEIILAPTNIGYVENTILSSSTTPNNIIIGDSQTKNVKKYSKNVTLIDALTKGSMGVGWLRDQVAAYPVSSNVKNVVLCIGVNGGYSSNGPDEKGLFTALQKTFPNAKIYAVQGSWGWGGVSDYSETTVRKYYKTYYQNKGATLIDPPIGYGDPHTDKPVYKLIGAAIDLLIN